MIRRLINYGMWLNVALVCSALVALLFGRMDLMRLFFYPAVILTFVALYITERLPADDDSPQGGDG